jgi:hypothetical protein
MHLVHASSLFVHLLCLAVFGAASFAGILLDRSLWSSAAAGRTAAALEVARIGLALGRLAQVASALVLLSGLGLLWSSNFAQWGGTWLYGKLALFVALGALGGIIGGKGGRRVLAILEEKSAAGAAVSLDGELAALKGRFATFHLVMPLMFVMVILLAVFRP